MKLFIDLTDDERFLDGNIPIKMNERDNLTGADSGIEIGEEIELVLSVRQAITLFDVLDAWLHSTPIKFVGGIERRVLDAIKMTVEEHGEAVRAMNKRPEDLAHVLYENMKFRGLRFRMTGDEADRSDTLAERSKLFRNKE